MSNDAPENMDTGDDTQKGSAAATYVGPIDHADATWAPGQDDASDEGGYRDDESDESMDPPRGQPGSGTEADPNATYLPTEDASVGDLWADACESSTPCQTLKSPGDAKRSPRIPDPTRPSDKPPDLSAQGYDLLEVLGEGGVGVVYQAVQKSVERTVAVKMIKPGVGRDATEQEKFVSEALVTGKLDHPNIVPIHDLDTTTDGQPFYTMKVVRGTPWADVVQENTVHQNLRVLLDVCDAVSFAHSRGVIHRDLKPDNVMLGEFGEVQLMDWGLGACVSSDGEAVDLSPTQAAGGTPAYMAPEMVTGNDGPVGTHSDIYLLGAILHQIVTGKPPHPGKRVLDTLVNARKNVIQQAEAAGALADIARKAMQTEPAERYPSVDVFKQALLDYQSHAESITLCQRSADDLRRARKNWHYELFAQALFGFREALVLWEENEEATAGIRDAQLHYASCAFEKGDLDLAASTLNPTCSDHAGLAEEVRRAQSRRDLARRRLKLFRVTAITLTAAVVVILTVASIWINSAKRQAVAAKEVALVAKESETEQRKLAESAKAKAQAEEARAVKALADLKTAYADLVKAQEEEPRARAEAKESDRVATQTRDELARTGMLRDGSWWVTDAATAQQAQRAAAEATGKPVELVITLSGDVKVTMRLIPPGEFVMGSRPEEENRAADEHLHRVHHTEAFYLGKFELTETQWQALTGELPPSATDRDPDPTLPVTGVSYDRIVQDLLPALEAYTPEGYRFRLPSEAEWEYGCRAGTATAYHAGDGEGALDSAGWYLANSDRKVQPIGSKAPNAFGLHDMHGNANEVCIDQYAVGFYLESPVENPMAAREGDTPVVRGGSVLNIPKHCRSAYRSYAYRKNDYPFLGLRLALVPVRDPDATAATRPAAEKPANP